MDRRYLQEYSMMNNYLMNGGFPPYGSPYLAHYGVLGMKWGQHLFAKQASKEQAKTVSGKSDGKRAKRRLFKFVGRKRTNNAKNKNSKDLVEDKETRKKQILKSRSSKELYKNADLFTNEELRAAYNRLSLEKQIRDLNVEPDSLNKINKWINGTQRNRKLASDAINIASDGIKAYNMVADIYNTFSGSPNKMTRIGKKK